MTNPFSANGSRLAWGLSVFIAVALSGMLAGLAWRYIDGIQQTVNANGQLLTDILIKQALIYERQQMVIQKLDRLETDMAKLRLGHPEITR